MTAGKLKSDGLGGSIGVSNTLGLGSRKYITTYKMHMLTICIILVSGYTKDSCPCLSLTLAFQRSNEMYKNIKFPYRKVESFWRHKHDSYIQYLITSLFVTTALVEWMILVMLLSGDIELNPGPGSVDGTTESINSSSSSSFETLTNHLSILHLNIQSIVPKLDLIEGEAASYDVLVFSESWLNPNVPDESLHMENFSPPFRTDRTDRTGGGVIVYVRDTISSKRRSDLEIRGLEATWVEIQVRSKKVLIGGFY